VSGNGEMSQLMQMEDLVVRRRCTSEQSQPGFEAVEKLDGGGKVNLVESEKLPELFPDDVESMLSDFESYEYLTSDNTISGFLSSYEANGDDVGSVLSEAENYGYLLSNGPVPETTLEDAVFQDTGQPTGIDTSCMDLCSRSPHVAATSVHSSVTVQGPVSPGFVTGTLLQQLTIGTTPLAVSGRNGPPLVIQYTPKQV